MLGGVLEQLQRRAVHRAYAHDVHFAQHSDTAKLINSIYTLERKASDTLCEDIFVISIE